MILNVNFNIPRVPLPRVPVLAEDADLTTAGGVGGFVVGAGRGTAPAEPERRPRGVPLLPFQRAPWPISSSARNVLNKYYKNIYTYLKHKA